MIRLRGHNLSATFDRHDDARAWAAKEEARILSSARLAEGSVAGTVGDLLRRYQEDVTPTKRGEKWEDVRLTMFLRDAELERTRLRDFGPEHVARWRDARLKLVSAATVNRELNLLSAVFTTAVREWRIGLRENPVRLVKRPPATPARKRRVSDDDFAAVRKRLGWDGVSRPASSAQWVAWAHLFALETAMRKQEILQMTPDRVHLARRCVELLDGQEKDREGQTKTGAGRLVPLSSRALALLELAKPWGEHIVPVASGNLDKLFREAAYAAGRRGLHFHDTRREALTRMAPRVGDPLHLARISGHRSPKQLLEYFVPDPGDLADRLG